jgi:hypothetical protein
MRLMIETKGPGSPVGLNLGALTAVAAVAAHLLSADQWGVTLCFFKAVTGKPCFTCGTTRALAALGRADPGAALRAQPLVTAAALAVLTWAVIDLALLVRGHRLTVSVTTRGSGAATAGVTIALLVLNWIYLIRTGV